jgi:hypothetical protein
MFEKDLVDEIYLDNVAEKWPYVNVLDFIWYRHFDLFVSDLYIYISHSYVTRYRSKQGLN